MTSNPQHSVKPTAYLDQNILDQFVKYGIGNFGQHLKPFQVVYSDETLAEIKRSIGYEKKFLQVLKDFDAFHLKILIEQPGFITTDKAVITDRDVFGAFEEFCSNNGGDDNIGKALSQLLFKFSGGRAGDSISDIHAELIDSFSQIMNEMRGDADEFPTKIKDQIEEYAVAMKNHLKTTLQELERTIAKDIPNTSNLNAIKLYRDATKIGPKKLNNIKPPKVIDKIWAMYKPLPQINSHYRGLEDFFQIRSTTEKSLHLHQKVTAMYNVLNTIGYFPDTEVHEETGFVRFMSDNSHASMASFCTLLLSRDKNFVKKVKAVYEHLGVPTEVLLIKFNNPSIAV